MLESFLALWRGESPQDVVWTADITFWMTGQRKLGRWRREWDTDEGYVNFHLQLGLFPYYTWGCSMHTTEEFTVDVRRETKTEGDHRIQHLITPWGTLTATGQSFPMSGEPIPVKHFVESEADLDVLLRTIESRTLRTEGIRRQLDRMNYWRLLGAYPLFCLPASPLSQFVYAWANLPHAIMLLFDCPDKVRTLFTLLEEQEQSIMDAVCEASLPLVHFPDNLSGETLTGLYDEWMAPAHRRRLDRLHAAGTKATIHLSGTARGELLPKLSRMGFDGVEALHPYPVGDITAAEMRALVPPEDDDFVLWGGVPGAMFAPPYEWPQMEKHVLEVIDAWGGRRFILGSADQVPPDANIDFCRRIADLLQTQT